MDFRVIKPPTRQPSRPGDCGLSCSLVAFLGKLASGWSFVSTSPQSPGGGVGIDCPAATVGLIFSGPWAQRWDCSPRR